VSVRGHRFDPSRTQPCILAAVDAQIAAAQSTSLTDRLPRLANLVETGAQSPQEIGSRASLRSHGFVASFVLFAAATNYDMVVVRVSDENSGIGDADLEKVFDPFYTTKEAGTGLGLSISHQILSQHHGSITVERNLETRYDVHAELASPAEPYPRGSELGPL
jgi:signal transduction histidine kinase